MVLKLIQIKINPNKNLFACLVTFSVLVFTDSEQFWFETDVKAVRSSYRTGIAALGVMLDLCGPILASFVHSSQDSLRYQDINSSQPQKPLHNRDQFRKIEHLELINNFLWHDTSHRGFSTVLGLLLSFWAHLTIFCQQKYWVTHWAFIST